MRTRPMPEARFGRNFRGYLAALLPLVATASPFLPRPAGASELAYTFLDFQALNHSVDAAGVQMPVPEQTVSVQAGNGDGVAVGGSFAIADRFYLGGLYRSSIIDDTGVVSSPLATAPIDDEFDATLGRLAFGYLHPIGENLDLVAEVSYDSATYDFGSVAGENFDADGSGVGAQLGFRWNPVRALELYAFGRYSAVGKSRLSTREFEADTLVSAGFRWYFFEDLGLGLEFESGEIETTTISMRFSFGRLSL